MGKDGQYKILEGELTGTLRALLQAVERTVMVGNDVRGKATAYNDVMQEAVYAQVEKNRLIFSLKEGPDTEELIKALKCSTVPGHKDCDGCPYEMLEEIKPDFPVPADCEIDGVGYWRSCDYDSMAWDAAHVLEILKI